MTLTEKIKILSMFDICSGLSASILEELAEHMQHIFIPQMKVFIDEGVDADKAFFVYSGMASVYRTSLDGEIVNTEFRGAPDIVGKTGLIDGKMSSTSAIAVTAIDALVLDQSDFVVFVNKHPDFAFRMLSHFTEKMHVYAMFLEDLLTTSLHQRTWQMLQYIASYFPGKEITLSQEELANLLWGTRARVTEVLHALEKEGKIQIQHRRIKLN